MKLFLIDWISVFFDRKDVDTKGLIKQIAETRAEEMKIISNAVKRKFYYWWNWIQRWKNFN
jgi:hypothetical protein